MQDANAMARPDAAAAPLPGQSAAAPPAGGQDGSAFALLDERDEWLEFSRPVPPPAQPPGGQPAACWESAVVFDGMYCAACATTIEQALAAVPGVRDVQVNAASHRGRVVWEEGRTRPSEWMQAVARTGYRPLPAHDAQASERRQAETRKMLWRLGVAGMCMMQVMMYATPTYFAAPGDITPDMQSLLRWAQWVLSIPVLLFSCQPFFANALRDLRQRSVSMDLPVALGMLIAFAGSTLGTFEPGGVFGREVYFDSFTMFVFFLLVGRWLELRLRDRTAGALDALMHRLPDSVERQTPQGGWQRVSLRRLRAGDVVRVLPGQAFPADGVLLRGQTLTDEALLTGESTPLPRGAGAQVIAGSHNLTAPVELRIEHVGAGTRYAQIVNLMEQAATSKPHIAQLADRLAKPFLLAVLLAAALACAWHWREDPAHALMTAVAVLVVTCPCALSLATPVAMLASAGSMARSGVLVRRLHALETLAEAKVAVFDKTGTLTRDAFVLERIDVREGASCAQALALAAQLARGSLHPVSRALVQAAEKQGLAASGAPSLADVEEVAGQGMQALWPGHGRVRLGSALFCQLADGAGQGAAAARHGPVSHLSDAHGWLASFALREDVRSDAPATVGALQAAGMQVHMLSGDQPQAVQAVAQQVGIATARGGCTPADKLAALQGLQDQGAIVAMVGDGLNDGPVLARAHVSFAVGRSAPLARARSDFVVLGEQLMLVAFARQKAQKTMLVVRQNLGWAAAYNALGVPLAVAGWMPAWASGLGMALSSLLVVLNALRLSGAAAPLPAETA